MHRQCQRRVEDSLIALQPLVLHPGMGKVGTAIIPKKSVPQGSMFWLSCPPTSGIRGAGEVRKSFWRIPLMHFLQPVR